MNTKTYQINNFQSIVARFLILAVFLSMFAYLYLVNATAFKAASYKRISERISDIQSEIGELELAFINKNRNIDENMSGELKLVPQEKSSIVFAKRDVASRLSLNLGE